jgi:hypothetical protein
MEAAKNNVPSKMPPVDNESQCHGLLGMTRVMTLDER